MTADDGRIGEFLAAHGGPFYELQLRLRMLREHSLQAGRRAALFVALAWGVPLLLSLFAGRAVGPFAERPYLLDIGVWARFAIAIAAMTLAEGQVEGQLRQTLKQFTQAPLLAPTSFEPAARAVTTALKRRDSRLAEAVCIVAAIALSLLSLINFAQAGSHSWAVAVGPDGVSLTVAGWLVSAIQQPILLLPVAAWPVASRRLVDAAAPDRSARTAAGYDPP